MQRWFFLEDRKRPKYKTTPKQSTVLKEENMTELLAQDWLFTVITPNIRPNEKVFITGNTPELGEWDYTKIVLLENKINTSSWSISIKIPNTCDVLYRYGIALINNETNDVLIRKWETFITPRVLKDTVLHPFVEEFGKNNDVAAVTTGWLTTQTLIQFKFLNNPLKLRHISDRLVYIKVTPVKLSFDNECVKDQESSSSEVPDVDYVTENPSVEVVEVSTLSNDKALCNLKPQQQFGRQYNTDDILIVNMTVLDHKALAYLVDFYSYSSSAAAEHAPYHVGFTYVLPSMLKPSEGTLQLPVTCNVKHRPLGTINIEYLIINPMSEKLNSFDVSYAKYWSKTWTGLDVGHRGLGASFKTKTHSIRENTIASLKKAASSGADLLEFDVQLSKDLVPVIYHDFHVCISMKRKKEVGYSEMLELPVKDLTLEQLQKLKIYHLVEGRSHEEMFFDEDLEEHQPFPTLEHCLDTIQQDVGFNVELKWTMEMQDGTFELNNPFDMNIYVDKVLEVVLKKAGDRRIVFSCFNPDICTMVRNKQNKYPVMFLTVGRTKKYEPYRDPRCGSIPAAVQSAVSTDILGIVVHTEDLLRDPSQVRLATDAGLIIFCWGDDNNDKETIKRLKVLGLHAVIYDKLDQYTSKQVKESIFLAEARESQGDILQWVKQNEVTVSEPSIESPDQDHRTSLDIDLETIRRNQQLNSTATSLESIDNPMDLRDEFEENKLKRNQEIITAIDKESQLKQQVITINNAFPECSRGACKSKKPRPN